MACHGGSIGECRGCIHDHAFGGWMGVMGGEGRFGIVVNVVHGGDGSAEYFVLECFQRYFFAIIAPASPSFLVGVNVIFATAAAAVVLSRIPSVATLLLAFAKGGIPRHFHLVANAPFLYFATGRGIVESVIFNVLVRFAPFANGSILESTMCAIFLVFGLQWRPIIFGIIGVAIFVLHHPVDARQCVILVIVAAAAGLLRLVILLWPFILKIFGPRFAMAVVTAIDFYLARTGCPNFSLFIRRRLPALLLLGGPFHLLPHVLPHGLLRYILILPRRCHFLSA
mmetsp:Transcript_27763/g.59305  ORF Transcript_27763/g.59305 Transcript_27763/m.59305 type:complete len:283 (+) Transcript_27763:1838-2686(+)